MFFFVVPNVLLFVPDVFFIVPNVLLTERYYLLRKKEKKKYS